MKDPKILLNLPAEAEPFNGRITHKTTRQLVIVEQSDFTQGGTQPVKKTYYEVRVNAPYRMTQAERLNASTTSYGPSLFGAYIFNWMSNDIHSFGYDLTEANENEIILSQPDGDYARYYKGTGTQLFIDRVTKINPTNIANRMSVHRIQESITWVNLPGVPPKTKKQTWRSKPKFISYTYDQLQQLVGLSPDQIAYEMRSTFIGESVDQTKYIANIATDIEINGGDYVGKMYINGQDANTFNYRALITSFGQLCPSYNASWRLYNTPPTGETITGATLVVSKPANDTVITVVATSENDRYDPTLDVIYYDPSLPQRATLIFYCEFGTTGKNENWGQVLDLETGYEGPWQ